MHLSLHPYVPRIETIRTRDPELLFPFWATDFRNALDNLKPHELSDKFPLKLRLPITPPKPQTGPRTQF